MHRPHKVLYAINKLSRSTYLRTPSGNQKAREILAFCSFCSFCTIFLHPQKLEKSPLRDFFSN